MKTPLLFLFAAATLAAEKPNIVLIMADDQGYGDAGCYNPESKIPTPGIDRLAREGIRFTDAHSGAAVCTPTRYGLLTGRYAWRSRLQSGVLTTENEKGCLIAAAVLTVPELLKQHGYRTALVGKWHLGYRYVFPAGETGLKTVTTKKPYGTFRVQAAPVGSIVCDGPTAHGFDEFHGFHHAREMHSWCKNDRVTETHQCRLCWDRDSSRCCQRNVPPMSSQASSSAALTLAVKFSCGSSSSTRRATAAHASTDTAACAAREDTG